MGGADGLARRLNAADGTALIVSNVVGVGIFTTPGLVASMVAGPGMFLVVWIGGGVLALIGGLVYAELGGAYPEAGGEYVYIREAFGPGAAFLSGWTSLIAGFTGAIAAGAVALAIYVERLVPGLAEVAPWRVDLGPLAIELGPRRLIAIAVIAGLGLVHARGLGPGRAVQSALAALSVATIVALVVIGLASPSADAALPSQSPGATSGEGGPILALVLVMFTFSGWNAAAYLAGEMRSPGRSLHRAVVGGTVLVTVLYLGLNLLYLRTISFPGMRGSVAVMDLAAGAVFSRAGGLAVALVVSLALVSGVSAMLMAGPRIYFAMARDGALPAAFGRVDPSSGAPSLAVAVQTVWACALVMTGTFEGLLTYTGFAVVLFSAAAVAALFVLRRRPGYGRHPHVPAWGHPWAPALFLVASAAMLIQAIRFAPGPSLAGAALIVAGIPVYLWTRRRPSPPTEAVPPITSILTGEES